LPKATINKNGGRLVGGNKGRNKNSRRSKTQMQFVGKRITPTKKRDRTKKGGSSREGETKREKKEKRRKVSSTTKKEKPNEWPGHIRAPYKWRNRRNCEKAKIPSKDPRTGVQRILLRPKGRPVERGQQIQPSGHSLSKL